MKFLFLVDSDPKNIRWMPAYFDERKYTTLTLGMDGSMKNRTVSWRRIILFYNYINLSIKAVRKSKKEDFIISPNFIIGAFAGFFCKIFGIDRTILSLNMISHEKGLFNKLVRKIVYNTAFKYKNFYITVNSAELIEEYSTEYSIDKSHCFLLLDCIQNHYETSAYVPGDGTVFCGGEAKRDWPTLFQAANQLPKVQFTCVARKINFDKSLSIPANATMYFDTDQDFFYNKLKEASVVAMPLSTTAPAGLIVLIRAALLSKPVIVTSTSSTRNYVTDKQNGILIDKGDDKALAEQINVLLMDNNYREKLCINLKETMKKFSRENYLKTLEDIALQIKSN